MHKYVVGKLFILPPDIDERSMNWPINRVSRSNICRIHSRCSAMLETAGGCYHVSSTSGLVGQSPRALRSIFRSVDPLRRAGSAGTHGNRSIRSRPSACLIGCPVRLPIATINRQRMDASR